MRDVAEVLDLAERLRVPVVRPSRRAASACRPPRPATSGGAAARAARRRGTSRRGPRARRPESCRPGPHRESCGRARVAGSSTQRPSPVYAHEWYGQRTQAPSTVPALIRAPRCAQRSSTTETVPSVARNTARSRPSRRARRRPRRPVRRPSGRRDAKSAPPSSQKGLIGRGLPKARRPSGSARVQVVVDREPAHAHRVGDALDRAPQRERAPIVEQADRELLLLPRHLGRARPRAPVRRPPSSARASPASPAAADRRPAPPPTAAGCRRPAPGRSTDELGAQRVGDRFQRAQQGVTRGDHGGERNGGGA